MRPWNLPRSVGISVIAMKEFNAINVIAYFGITESTMTAKTTEKTARAIRKEITLVMLLVEEAAALVV